MSAPLVTPDDLGVYLNDSGINVGRASAMITDAQTLCETIVSPLPTAASVVVKRVAARAYVTTTTTKGAQIAAAGSPFVGTVGSAGGVWLTRADKADLRRLAGSGGAFSIDPLPKGVSAVQCVTVGGAPTGGTFTLSFVNQPTTGIPWNADAPTVQSAINALTAIGAGNVLVTGNAGGPWTITFAGVLATTPVPTLGADASGLTGGTPSVVVTVVTKGVLAAGQGLPPWDFDYYDFGSTQYVPGGFL